MQPDTQTTLHFLTVYTAVSKWSAVFGITWITHPNSEDCTVVLAVWAQIAVLQNWHQNCLITTDTQCNSFHVGKNAVHSKCNGWRQERNLCAPNTTSTKARRVPAQKQSPKPQQKDGSQVTICGSGLRSFGIRYDLYQCHPQIAGKLLW